MPFEKGKSGNPAGSKPGVQRKITIELKQMIMGALEESGGQQYLVKQAEENPTAFMTLIGKYIPSEINAKMSGAVKVDGTIRFVRPDDKL